MQEKHVWQTKNAKSHIVRRASSTKQSFKCDVGKNLSTIRCISFTVVRHIQIRKSQVVSGCRDSKSKICSVIIFDFQQKPVHKSQQLGCRQLLDTYSLLLLVWVVQRVQDFTKLNWSKAAVIVVVPKHTPKHLDHTEVVRRLSGWKVGVRSTTFWHPQDWVRSEVTALQVQDHSERDFKFLSIWCCTFFRDKNTSKGTVTWKERLIISLQY